MWKIVVGFIAFAALALFVISKGGDSVDMSGEKHDTGSHDVAASAAHGAASAAAGAANVVASAAAEVASAASTAADKLSNAASK